MWCVMGMREKSQKIPRLVALPSPFLQYGGQPLFSVQEHRKQAGPTLNGREFKSTGMKRKRQGWGQRGQVA